MRARPFTCITGLLLLFLLVSPDLQGDTEQLIDQVYMARQCLRDGGPVPCPAGQFAPLQFLLTVPLTYLPLPKHVILHVLARVSLLAFLAMNWLAFRALLPRSPRAAWLAVAVLCVGVLPNYARSSFGELLAALAIFGATLAPLAGARAIATAALVFAAGISKDTAIVLLFPLYFAATRLAGWPIARAAAPYAAGGVAAAATLVAFNFFRWGSWQNLGYLAPHYFVPNLELHLNHMAAIWISPSGGLLWYWPTFGALLAWALARRPAQAADRVALAGVALTLAGATLLFGRWFTPMGWWAWGPRLMLPWVPACALLLLWRATPRVSAAVAVALALASIPQVLVFFHTEASRVVFAPAPGFDPSAPFWGRATVPPEMLEHHVSHQSALWKSPGPLLAALFGRPRHFSEPVAVFVLAVAIAFYAQLGRRITRARPGSEKPGDPAAA